MVDRVHGQRWIVFDVETNKVVSTGHFRTKGGKTKVKDIFNLKTIDIDLAKQVL